MTSTRLTLAALATLALVGTTTALAGISESVPTKLTMKNRPPAFHGKVKTDVPDCESERRVKLFYSTNTGKGTGGLELIGRTNSDSSGSWFIDATPLRSGGYVAKVKQHIVEIDGVLVRCEPDFARGIQVDKGGETPVAHVSGIVTIGENPPYFHGKVGAENETCAGPRPVKVWERLDNGERVLHGKTESDLSSPRAKWELLVDRVHPGHYFATAPRHRMGSAADPAGVFVCLRAKSRVIEIG